LDSEDVVMAAGVPTVWNFLLKHCRDNGLTLSKVKSTIIGGSAVPLSMI
jgi:fatty-acyl-CoA synthase